MFSREFRRQERAKIKIYFTFGAFVVLLSSSFVVAVVVSTGAAGRAFGGCPCFRGVFRPFALPFVSLLLSFPALPFKYSSISRFKGVFRGFYGADVYLYGFGVLR